MVVARLRNWAGTALFLPAFVLILLVFDVVQRVARLFGQRPQEYVAGALQVALVWAFRLCGTRITVERSPAVRPWTAYVIVSNHQSMFDIPLLGQVFFSNFPKYIAKRSLGRFIPSVSYNLRRGGHVLIDRTDGRGAVAAIRALGAHVRTGRASALIFPEGTRARHGALGEFKPAGTLALFEEAPDAPIVPVAVDGSWALLHHNLFPLPWGVRIRLWVGAPIPRTPDEDRPALLARTREAIAARLETWRVDRLASPRD